MRRGSRTKTTVEGQSRTHGYLDEPFEGYGENAGREMLKVQNNFRKPQTTRGRSAFLMLCLWMTLIIVLSGTRKV